MLLVWYGEAAPGKTSPAGRYLLARMYWQVTGLPLPSLRIESGGRPVLSEGPGFSFSISHTGTRVFTALCTGPVGLDAERLERRVRLELAPRILAPEELHAFRSAGSPPALLLKYWTLKESWGKFTGEGIRGYPNNLSFRLENGVPHLTGSAAYFQTTERLGCTLALCTLLPERPQFRQLSLPPALSHAAQVLQYNEEQL